MGKFFNVTYTNKGIYLTYDFLKSNKIVSYQSKNLVLCLKANKSKKDK